MQVMGKPSYLVKAFVMSVPHISWMVSGMMGPSWFWALDEKMTSYSKCAMHEMGSNARNK